MCVYSVKKEKKNIVDTMQPTSSTGIVDYLTSAATVPSFINGPVMRPMNHGQTDQPSHVIFVRQSIIPHANGLFVYNLLGDA